MADALPSRLYWLKRHFPSLCALGRLLGWTAVTLYLAFALFVLGLRHVVLPKIEDYRPQIERLLGAQIGLPVSLGGLQAHWDGLRPGLVIERLVLRDRVGGPALTFDRVEAVLSWHSLWRLTPVLHHLELRDLDLSLRRDAQGTLFVAGLPFATQGDDDGFANWLLAQEQIIIRNATVSWHDELRAAPPLVLRALNFRLENRGRRHRFGFTALPPPQLASRLDVRGDFKGRDLETFETWQGQAFAALEYVDLAGWQPWIDYPLELPQGRGGLRLWADFASERLQGVTTDLHLADLALRFDPGLPMLNLRQLHGRLALSLRARHGWTLTAGRLAFAAGDTVQPASDWRLDWRSASPGSDDGQGALTVGRLDLAALATIAGTLPIDAIWRDRIAAAAPRGRIDDLILRWRRQGAGIAAWAVQARVQGLSLAPHDGLPGISVLDGELRGDEQAGRLSLRATPFALILPEVFPLGGIAFERLAGELVWGYEDGRLAVRLKQLTFANADLSGTAQGRWRAAAPGEGPGHLMLEAHIPRLAGAEVWRYLPLAVNKDSRDWLKQAIIAGQAENVSLHLDGDLAHFPFHDARHGRFRVHGRLRDCRLRYAPDWPELNAVAGELTFEGVGMRLRGEAGQILGTRVREVLAEIPNLDTPTPELKLSGKVDGPVSEFLRFIELSPVAERIDHFTAGMSATGNGTLALKLDMPLAQVVDTRIEGRFRFAGNRLTLANDLPPLMETQGELMFTGDRLEVKKARTRFVGLPLSVDVFTEPGGTIRARAEGQLNIAALRAQMPHPLLDHLSGMAPLAAQLTVKKKVLELRVESGLRGIASSLPEPFDKIANTVLPLVVERLPLDAEGRRERWSLTLGAALRLQLQRRLGTGEAVIEQGLVALGRRALNPPPLPDKGLTLVGEFDRLDSDFWRRLFEEGRGGGQLPPVSRLELRADELVLRQRSLHALKLSGRQEGERWRFDIDSREAVGYIDWLPSGLGRLDGRFTLLAIPDGHETERAAATTQVSSADAARELPAVRLSAERFRFGARELGALKLEGENRDGFWHGRAVISNADGRLEAQGRWRPVPADFRMRFDLRVDSIDRLLERLGLPNTVRRGTARLTGELGWRASPLEFDITTMVGAIRLSAANGQFAKLEPGVGRLLGVLSLQALPRRITLDFRDIFSEGLSFDAIEGQARIEHGRIETQDLTIRGPQAKIDLRGEANLRAETQNLRVRVQPVIGDSLATGVMLFVNPTAGAAVWLADKLLQDPLGRAFAWEFAVTGPWQEPKVEKIAAPRSTESGGETR